LIIDIGYFYFLPRIPRLVAWSCYRARREPRSLPLHAG